MKRVYGVTVSTIACRNYKQDILEVIEEVVRETPIRRFRLMSYWSETQPETNKYDFKSLDAQINKVAAANGEITLCLGMRQPRWPECHLPAWAEELEPAERNEKLYEFIETVVKRYKDSDRIISYQLENEALNHGIGRCTDYDRSRLVKEFELVKRLDPSRPVIMSTSNSWGLPARSPRPDIIGFSYYLYEWGKGKPTNKPLPWQLHWLRRQLAKIVLRKPSFCHELQAEPWGPVGNELLTDEQQIELMDEARLRRHIAYAQKTGAQTIDLWGIEWMLWRKREYGDESLLNVLKKL